MTTKKLTSEEKAERKRIRAEKRAKKPVKKEKVTFEEKVSKEFLEAIKDVGLEPFTEKLTSVENAPGLEDLYVSKQDREEEKNKPEVKTIIFNNEKKEWEDEDGNPVYLDSVFPIEGATAQLIEEPEEEEESENVVEQLTLPAEDENILPAISFANERAKVDIQEIIRTKDIVEPVEPPKPRIPDSNKVLIEDSLKIDKNIPTRKTDARGIIMMGGRIIKTN